MNILWEKARIINSIFQKFILKQLGEKENKTLIQQKTVFLIQYQIIIYSQINHWENLFLHIQKILFKHNKINKIQEIIIIIMKELQEYLLLEKI
jgi:hypothetical protein